MYTIYYCNRDYRSQCCSMKTLRKFSSRKTIAMYVFTFCAYCGKCFRLFENCSVRNAHANSIEYFRTQHSIWYSLLICYLFCTVNMPSNFCWNKSIANFKLGIHVISVELSHQFWSFSHFPLEFQVIVKQFSVQK